MLAFRVRVAGRVQGVGYRAFAVREASLLGIRCDARNCEDGTVEIDGTGERSALTAYCDRLAVGPPLSSVQSVSVENIRERGEEEEPR